MIILGVETSCDETALCILETRGHGENFEYKIRGNIVHSQIELHKEYGGVYPALAKREHIKNLPILFEQIKKETGIKEKDIGAIAVIQGEGLQNRTFCYVDDVISGVELVMEHGVPGEAYNIGGTEQITIKTFAEHVLRLTESSSKIVSVPRPTHDHSGRLPDTSKARAPPHLS
jgi:nucleoside-diphosphate-sugar epimerase